MKRRSYIRPTGRGFRRSRVKDVINYTLALLLFLMAGIFLGVIVIEWMAGCGESYVDANGVRHQYECVFLTLHNEE